MMNRLMNHVFDNEKSFFSRKFFMFSFLASVVVLGLTSTFVFAQQEAEKSVLPIDPAFGQHRIWDDGQAEVAKYQASRVIYGEPREYELISVLVSEPFNADQLVKADPPYEGKNVVPVLKSHTVEQIPTPNYDYHFATSYFLPRAAIDSPMKATYMGFEWCGSTMKEMRLAQETPMYRAHSYWEGQAMMAEPLELPEDVLFEDRLWVTLRAADMEVADSVVVDVVPVQVSNKAAMPRSMKMKITRVEPESHDAVKAMTVGDKTWAKGDQIVYVVEPAKNPAPGMSAVYAFDAEFPHALMMLKDDRNRITMELSSIERDAYWAWD